MATELAKAYVQIIPSAQGISGKIQQAIEPEAEVAGTSFGGKLVSTIKNVIATAAIGKALVSTINEGAAIEQSMGGIETLFKESAEKMHQNAINAYKTAGLSANAYMEQSTSFAASLLSSLGNNTSKAADIADMAMTDMSDNANKMGTNMEDITNAYQGFAKQNYTMLDNLKLGYGGTKGEMQRLLDKAQELSGVEYNIDNLADVYSAIHVIQGELGITGTTAIEAEGTISGSFNMMKASATNFLASLTGVKDGNGNAILSVEDSLNDLVNSAVSFASNVIPAIGSVMTSLPKAIVQAMQTYGPQAIVAAQEMLANLLTYIPSMLTSFTTVGVELLNQISSGLTSGIPTFCAQFLPMLVTISENLRANAGQLIDAGLNLIENLAQGIANSLPTLIATVPQIITNIAGIINDNMPKILSTGIEILITLTKGIINAIPTLIANLPKIFTAAESVLSAMNWLGVGKNLMNLLVNGVKALVHLPGQIIKGAFNTAKQMITTGFSWGSVGRNIIHGIANGLSAAGHMLWDTVKGILGSFKDNVLSFFGIHSPSRWGAFVGKMIDAGVANGLIDNTSLVSNAANELQRSLKGPFKASADLITGSTVANSEKDSILSAKLEQLLEYLKQKSRGSDKIVINMNDREAARALREMGVVFE